MRKVTESSVQQRKQPQTFEDQRRRTREAIENKRPIDAETDAKRKQQWISRLIGTDEQISEGILKNDTRLLESLPAEKRTVAEKIQGGSIDFVPANFLARGARAARAVVRVVDAQGDAVGTGFLVVPGVLITNQHVIRNLEDARNSRIEFDYEASEGRGIKPITRYSLDPDVLFLHSPEAELDFALVAIGAREYGNGELESYGYCPLLNRSDKHMRAMFVNVVQHPEGRPKELSLRENRVTAEDERVLLYEADTLPGSSGSPVFNDFWEVVALHHYGQPSQSTVTVGTVTLNTEANEGIRISAIVANLRGRVSEPRLARGRDLLMRVLDPAAANPAHEVATVASFTSPGSQRNSSQSSIGTAADSANTGYAGQITVPLDIFVRVAADTHRLAQPRTVPGHDRELGERIMIDADYSNRRGYNPEFLGKTLPLPTIIKNADAIARLNASPNESELKYQHFSIVMNRKTKLAFFTAVNINGASWIDIDRDTGEPKGEAKEKWYVDPRIDVDAQLSQSFFDETSHLFDRGHLVRRLDPTWGSDRKAVRANADTFHFTNCSPQNWIFNQRTKFWQGIEMYLLERGAVEEEERLTVFSGPLFEDGHDFEIGGQTVPARFWKVAVRVKSGKLLASGFVVDQTEVINKQREGIPTAATLAKAVKEWRYAISEIERLTGLSFGDATKADSFTGAPEGAEAIPRHSLTSLSDAL